MGISSRYQHDYSNANFDNPRIVKKREAHRMLLLKLFIALGGITSAAILYFLFYSNYFRINNYEINGLKKIKQENIENIINNYFIKRKYLIFSRRNYWLLDKETLRTEIGKYYYFEKLEIKRKLPNKLIINISEKQPLVNWVVNDLCFHVDLTGAAIGYCENDSGLVTIRNIEQKNVEIGSTVVESKIINNIIDLHERAKNILKEHYNPIYYELDKNLLTAKSETGPDIRYNLELGIGGQVGRLDLIIRQKEVRDNYQKLKYIDLRFGEKVFYQ